tara:strand:+ start:252 stop:440 length:189 start_codon:yes stop_codon:yes gene_type:complete
MGLFGNLFKKKKGGSGAGNFLRGIVRRVPIIGEVYTNIIAPKPNEDHNSSSFGDWLDGHLGT